MTYRDITAAARMVTRAERYGSRLRCHTACAGRLGAASRPGGHGVRSRGPGRLGQKAFWSLCTPVEHGKQPRQR